MTHITLLAVRKRFGGGVNLIKKKAIKQKTELAFFLIFIEIAPWKMSSKLRHIPSRTFGKHSLDD